MPDAPAPTSAVVVPNQPNWHQRLLAYFAYAVVRLLAGSLRCHWTDQSGFVTNPSSPAIYATWHNRIALSMKNYYGYINKHTKASGLAVMVSASKDGAFLSAIFQCYGVKTMRGSSSRRGAQALRELTSWARKNHDLAITPDGPRGPCYIAQDGVIALAQLTGHPIVPMSHYLRHKITIRSWDRFQIPIPFTRCDFTYGPPIKVPRDASPELRETLRLQLQASLNSISPD